jgi:hypothetical protein
VCCCTPPRRVREADREAEKGERVDIFLLYRDIGEMDERVVHVIDCICIFAVTKSSKAMRILVGECEARKGLDGRADLIDSQWSIRGHQDI